MPHVFNLLEVKLKETILGKVLIELGLFGDEVVYPLPEPSTPSPKPPLSPSIQSSGSSPLFSKVYPDYLDFMRRNKRREGTIAETEETYRDFLIILGDKPIGDYTREDGREYRNTLSRLPKNRKKVTEYRDKTLSEIRYWQLEL